VVVEGQEVTVGTNKQTQTEKINWNKQIQTNKHKQTQCRGQDHLNESVTGTEKYKQRASLMRRLDILRSLQLDRALPITLAFTRKRRQRQHRSQDILRMKPNQNIPGLGNEQLKLRVFL
jgi:hypothetical protein